MEKFRIAYNNTLSHEGGYSYDPYDRGGETYKGIARKHWPQWEGWAIVDAIKTKVRVEELNTLLQKNIGLQGLVEQFYYEKFWMPVGGDDFNQDIANELFDTAVNQGRLMAGTYLQQALNKLNRNQQDYPDLITDGQIGFNTKHAYRLYMQTARFSSRNHDKLIKWLLRWLNYYQLRKYDLITNNDLTQERFVPGWTERV